MSILKMNLMALNYWELKEIIWSFCQPIRLEPFLLLVFTISENKPYTRAKEILKLHQKGSSK